MAPSGDAMRFEVMAVMATLALTGCPNPYRELPLPPSNEPECMSPAQYGETYAAMSPRMYVRPLSEHETAFLSDRIRTEYLLLQLRERHPDVGIDHVAQLDVEVGGELLERVPRTIEALAAATGEPAQSDAREAAQGLIIWATGGLALFANRVVETPSHVQLYALLETDVCRSRGAAKPGRRCELQQAMFARPADESAPAAILVRHDFLIEHSDGLRERACPPDNVARIPLPPGETLAERIAAKFPARKGPWRQQRQAPPPSTPVK